MNQPPRPSSDGGLSADAAVIDAPFGQDALADAQVVDASLVDSGLADLAMPFPPAGVNVNITGGWTGDLNLDGIDDIVLLSNTGSDTTAGIYVLFGEAGKRLVNFHQYMNTGARDPLALVATQLDGVGGLDIVLFAVDFGVDLVNDSESYLLVYKDVQFGFANSPLERNISNTDQAWQAPFNPGFSTSLFTARLKATGLPALICTHERGAFKFSVPSWGDATFSNTDAEILNSGETIGGVVVANLANGAVDDILTWTPTAAGMQWWVNDGSGGLSAVVVNAEPRTPFHVELYDMDGTPPLDAIGIIQSEIQSVPVDTDGATTSAEYNGQSYITGIVETTDLLVFDSDVGGADPRPEIVFSSPNCADAGVDPCLYMIRNAFVNGTTGELNSPSQPATWQLPMGFSPRFMVRGDFDDDDNPEVMVVAADGATICVRIVNAQFSSCD